MMIKCWIGWSQNISYFKGSVVPQSQAISGSPFTMEGMTTDQVEKKKKYHQWHFSF